MNLRTINITILSLAFASASAEVQLASWIGDGMVLQRDVPAVLCGSANAGEAVKVTLKKKSVETTADQDGRWSVTLPTQKAGGPYSIFVNEKEVKNVLFGDVFLCSGQSNMELPVSRVADMFADDVAAFSSDQIRFLTVPKVYNFSGPQSEFPATQWTGCTAGEVQSVSALCYFFARELNAQTGVAVGIVNASWGGTPIEAWMSEEAISRYPLSLSEKKLYESDDYCRMIKQKEGLDFYWWNKVLYATDPGKQAAVQWSAAEVDDSDWTAVDMFARWIDTRELSSTEKVSSDRTKAGSYWLRKHFTVSEAQAAEPATLRLGCIVDADSVWVNGHFVGTTSYMYPPRIYTIPAGVLHEGDNVVCVRVVSNGQEPHFVPEKPYKIITTQGEISLEGSWLLRRGAVTTSSPSMMFFCYKPVCLYNAMIAPLLGMQVRGAVWYQGESNVGREAEYALMLPDLMSDWRKAFGLPEMPFYVVELAGFLADDDPDQPAWMRFRDMQRRVCSEQPNAEIVENRDLGEWNDIHPLDKRTPAQRLTAKVVNQMNQKK